MVEWNYMLMGIMNAPIVFCKIMSQILGDLDCVIGYVDDFCIHSKTLSEHIGHIELIMKRLNDANIKINLSKCKWFCEKIKLFGFEVSGDGIEIDYDKVEPLKSRPEPKNIKELQSFIGFCNYYRKFVKNFAEIVSPLYKLLKKESILVWDQNCKDAFKKLIEILTNEPILRQPDFDKQFIIHTDSSGIAVGAILSQKDDNNREYAIAYASKKFQDYEQNMGITEKEMAAVVFGVKEFRHFIFGTKFKVVTDHNALRYLMNLKDPRGKLARWHFFLSQFDFDIEYREGKKHNNADYISRPTLEEINLMKDESYVDPYDDDCFMYNIKNTKKVFHINN